MNKLSSPENVFYPPMGIAHITEDISDLVKEKIEDKESIIIRTSSQPNSNPHLGTVMTMMTAFAIGEHLQEHFGIPANVVFDALENSPARQVLRDGVNYQLSLCDVEEEGQPLHKIYMRVFEEILSFLQDKTGIPYSIRYYKTFQEMAVIRKAVIHILNHPKHFSPILSPSKEKIHVRFPCPICKLMDKGAVNVQVENTTASSVKLGNICPDHGHHSVEIKEDNADYFDANTTIRDVLQGVLSLEEQKSDKNLSIMVDGGDWSGVWSLKVFCEGLMRFGYGELPFRLFAPVISDWSGAKFSKSIYLQGEAYKYLPIYVIDFSRFLNEFGEKGLNVLWRESQAWSSDPKKLFRNYSVEYFQMILDPLTSKSDGK